MPGHPPLYVFAPVYDEESYIPSFVESLVRHTTRIDPHAQLCLVDDGSGDATPTLLRDWQSREPLRRTVLTFPVHRGAGAALHEGFRWAVRTAPVEAYVAAVEADGSCELGALDGMFRSLDEGCDAVIGSRRTPGGAAHDFPAGRHMISRAANFLLRRRWPLPGLADYTIFFRVYRASVLRRAVHFLKHADPPFAGFTYNAAILAALIRHGARIGECPHVYRYKDHAQRGRRPVLSNAAELLALLIRGVPGNGLPPLP